MDDEVVFFSHDGHIDLRFGLRARVGIGQQAIQ